MDEKVKYTSVPPGIARMLPWVFGRMFSKTHKENTQYFEKLDPAQITTPIAPGKIRIAWLGHASLLIQLADGQTIVTDPIFKRKIAGTVPRITDVPLLPSDVPTPDVCLLSHDHYDHLDTAALRALSPKHIIGGTRISSALNKKYAVTELAWWESATVSGVRYTFVPAKHWSKRGLTAKNKRLWGGFVIETGTHTIYFAGDTAACDVDARVREKFPNIDLAIIPIGAYKPDFITEFHLSPAQSVDFYTKVGAKKFLPIHWGTYDLSDEGAYDPINDLMHAWQEKNLPEDGKLFLSVGGVTEL